MITISRIKITDSALAVIRENVEAQFQKVKLAHGTPHLNSVEQLALSFREPDDDPNLTSLFALLHDADDWKLFPSATGRPENAIHHMKAAGIPIFSIMAICEDIAKFGYSNRLAGLSPEMPECQAANDADMVDIMGASGIIRLMEYDFEVGEPFFDPKDLPRGFMTREDYMSVRQESGCRHLFEKVIRLPPMMLTRKGRIEADTRLQTTVMFMKALFREHHDAVWQNMIDQFLKNSGKEKIKTWMRTKSGSSAPR